MIWCGDVANEAIEASGANETGDTGGQTSHANP